MMEFYMRLCLLVILYQMVIPENTCISNNIQDEKVIFRNMYGYTYMYLTTNEKKGSDFEREKVGISGRV